jgi:predicted PurR-regulated permease PerM
MGEPGTTSAGGTPSNSAVSAVLLAAGLVLALTLIWLGRVIVLLLFAGVVVAVLLTAIVDWIKAKLRLKHGLALALILLTAAFLVILTLWISGPNIVEQFTRLRTDLPQAVQQSIERARDTVGVVGCSPNGRITLSYQTASAMPSHVSAGLYSAL